MIQKIEKMLARKRVPLLCMGKSQRECLKLALKGSPSLSGNGMLSFSFPEEPEKFRSFINGVMNAVAEEALVQYCSKYSGVVLTEIDERSYVDTDMPKAFVELMSKLTMMRMVIVCDSEAMLHHMFNCVGTFAVPGVIEIDRENLRSEALLESASLRLGTKFHDKRAFRHAFELYIKYSELPAFNADTFVRSIAGEEGWITEDSIRAEREDKSGYIYTCSMLMDKSCTGMREKNIRNGARKIGFLSSTEREKDDGIRERGV